MTQIEWLQQRLQTDRQIFAEMLSSVLTEAQLESKPAVLKGLTIREAWISWSAGFSPMDKVAAQ